MAFAHAWLPRAAVRFWPADAPRGARTCPPRVSQRRNAAGSGAFLPFSPLRYPTARMPATPVLRRLKRRPEFLRVQRKGRRWVTPGFLLQAWTRAGDHAIEPDAIRFGLTASKKVGNAVRRNRARRRLRALAMAYLQTRALPGTDYVLIARQDTAMRPWRDLVIDLTEALDRVGRPNTSRRAAGDRAR